MPLPQAAYLQLAEGNRRSESGSHIFIDVVQERVQAKFCSVGGMISTHYSSKCFNSQRQLTTFSTKSSGK